MNDVTQYLSAIEAGDPQAAEKLLPLVYDELRRLAAQRLAQEKPGQTLQATALVHEAYLRLLGPEVQDIDWANRAHFFAAAAEAMRRILVDRARRKLALRRGAGAGHLDIQEVEIAAPAPDEQLVALSDALDRFAALDAPKAELVKLRYFTGFTLEEAGAVLGISEPTAKRWWAYAKAWLYREMQSHRTGTP